MKSAVTCILLLFSTSWIAAAKEPPRPNAAENYYTLGTSAAEKKDAISGIFYFMRSQFVPSTKEQEAAAAAKVFALLTQDVSEGGDKKITLTLGPGFDQKGGALGALELARTLAAATIHLEDAQSQSKAERYVSALVDFVKIADETTQGSDSDEIKSSFVWQKAAAPVIQLERRGLLECFGYVLAARAGYAGAEDWLKKNAQKKQELEAALRELSKP